MAAKKSSTSEANTAPKSSKGSTAGLKKKRSPTSSGDTPSLPLSTKERDILEHIGRYRLSVREVIARLFFDNRKDRATDTLAKLEAQGRLQIIKRALPQGYSYYQLTAKGCVESGFTKERATPLTGLGLARSLGVLWFATMNGLKRARLKDDALPPNCPPVPGDPLHVVELLTPASGRIYRVYITAEDQPHPLREVRKAIAEISATDDGKQFIKSGAYGFAILVHEDEKRNRLRELLASDRAQLPADAIVIVETAPSPGNFPLYVK